MRRPCKERMRLTANHACLCVLLKILRYSQTGMVIPLYRGATMAMFLSGLGVSAAAPQIVLFLVKELGTPLPIAGLYYLTNLTAPIAGYLVGNHSDRAGERLVLFRLCALTGFAGWAAIALSTKVWMPFLISGLGAMARSGALKSRPAGESRDPLTKRKNRTLRHQIEFCPFIMAIPSRPTAAGR
jgi:hypothetical protein